MAMMAGRLSEGRASGRAGETNQTADVAKNLWKRLGHESSGLIKISRLIR